MDRSLSQKKLTEARECLNYGKFSQAFLLYEKIIRDFSHRAQIWLEYGAAAGGTGRIDLAEKIWSKAVSLEPKNADIYLKIGHQYTGLRISEKALEWFTRAGEVDPRSINPRIAIAVLHERYHRYAEARVAIEACLAIDPMDDQARYFNALIDRRENKLADAEQKLRALIDSHPQHQYVQYASRYDLADILNRTERYDEAMRMLAEAKAFVRRLGNIDELIREWDAEANSYRNRAQGLPKDVYQTWNKQFPAKDREPLPDLTLLGGHPRSGTTLLEQVVGAHPDVAAVDESHAFGTVAQGTISDNLTYALEKFNVIRRRYISLLNHDWGAGPFEGKKVVDKNPSHTARISILLRILPEMKILVALRDPRDVVISCFFQNIALNATNANFLTLERTAVHYTKLMDVWLASKRWDGFQWMETRYEDLVNDSEKEGKRVTQFLGLEWHPSQTKFYEKSSQKRIYSPTYHDASQPIYKRAVERWRAYEKYLEPVLPILEPYCKALGYS